MGYFDADPRIGAALAASVARVSTLVKLQFASQTVRVWPGFGDLYAGGQLWSGLGELGQISGLEQPMGGVAPTLTLTLSGVSPPLVAAAVAEPAEFRGLPVTVFLQCFTAAAIPLGAPYSLWAGLMDRLRIKADGPSTRVIEMIAETVFAGRTKPKWGLLSDRAQQERFPGDKGLDQMGFIENKQITWPVNY